MNIAQCTHILFCHQIDIFIEHPIKNATTHLNIYRAVAFCMQNSAMTQCPSRQHTLNGKWRLIHWTSISITPSKCPEYGGLDHKYRCDASTHRPYYIESLALYSETILRFIYPYIWHDNMYYCMHWLFELILIAAEMGCVGWFAFGKLCVQFWKQSKNILACNRAIYQSGKLGNIDVPAPLDNVQSGYAEQKKKCYTLICHSKSEKPIESRYLVSLTRNIHPIPFIYLSTRGKGAHVTWAA